MKNYMSFPFGVFFLCDIGHAAQWPIHRIVFVLIYSEYDWFCALIIHITQRKKETNETFARLLCKWKCKCKRGQTWHVCKFEPNALPKKIFFDTFRCVWRGRGVWFLVKNIFVHKHNALNTYHDRIWISMLRRNCKYFRGKILWKMLFSLRCSSFRAF